MTALAGMKAYAAIPPARPSKNSGEKRTIKYGLGKQDMAANINFFSKVVVDGAGNLHLVEKHSLPGSTTSLRFEMDTLVILHTCPHPLNREESYPRTPVKCEFIKSGVITDDDYCRNFRAENRRGFENNRLYYLGWSA